MSQNPKIYFAGEPGSPLSSVTGKPVKIEDIRKSLLKKGKNSKAVSLFEDPDFPATDTSLGNVGGDTAAQSGAAADKYTWLRPHELCANAKIPKPSFAAKQDDCSSKLCSEYDLVQGGLGDCWYLAALGAVTTRPDQLKLVIPEDNFNGFDDGVYCGAFHFRFYSVNDCKWIDVVVDDRLPSSDGLFGYKTPAFAKLTTKVKNAKVGEFWVALVEKAYAKFIGNYSKIEGGYTSQAFEDFTGGFSEIVDLTNYKDDKRDIEDLKSTIKRMVGTNNFLAVETHDEETAHKYDALAAYTDYCDYYSDSGKLTQEKHGYKFNKETKKVEIFKYKPGLGLCLGHAYTVLDFAEVKSKNGKQTYDLLKIKNPHAMHEWSGRFGDHDSKNWKLLKKDLRIKPTTGSRFADEGVFWMEIEDVIKYFSSLDICYFGMDGAKLCSVQGSWPPDLQSKSIQKRKEDLHYFKAYKFEAKRELKDLKRPDVANECMIALCISLQNYHSMLDPMPDFSYFLYKIAPNDHNINIREIYKHGEPLIVGEDNYCREVSKWAIIEPGTYVIVPILSTAPDKDTGVIPVPKELKGKPIGYTIRLFTENDTKLEELNFSTSASTTQEGSGRKRKRK